jgi:preprotein translocase subunit SecB
MRKSQLQLEHYHFLRLVIEADNNYHQQAVDFEYPDFSNAVFESSIAIGVPSKSDDTQNHYSIKLMLKGHKNEDGEHPFPYDFETVIEGFFTVHGKVESPEDLVKINGASILYGATRDALMTATSRFTNGPLLLPTVTFIDLKSSPTKTKKS